MRDYFFFFAVGFVVFFAAAFASTFFAIVFPLFSGFVHHLLLFSEICKKRTTEIGESPALVDCAVNTSIDAFTEWRFCPP